MNRAKQAIDLFGVVVTLQGDQAVADNLKVFFSFRLEELQNLGTDFIVKWERVEVGTGNAGLRCFRRDRFNGIANGEIQRNRLDRESETVAFLERGDVFNVLVTCVADFEQVGFEQGDAVRQELGQRSVQIVAKLRIQRILENVSEFPGNLGESWKSVTRRRPVQRMRSDVQALDVFAARFNLLQHADVLAQILQVLRRFLEEQFDGFALRDAHAVPPSRTSSDFCSSSAVGLR